MYIFNARDYRNRKSQDKLTSLSLSNFQHMFLSYIYYHWGEITPYIHVSLDPLHTLPGFITHFVRSDLFARTPKDSVFSKERRNQGTRESSVSPLLVVSVSVQHVSHGKNAIWRNCRITWLLFVTRTPVPCQVLFFQVVSTY